MQENECLQYRIILCKNKYICNTTRLQIKH